MNLVSKYEARHTFNAVHDDHLLVETMWLLNTVSGLSMVGIFFKVR